MSLVLIVDDVAAMREQYAYDLKRLGGHQTLTAGSGAEALQILESEPVACIILDLEMPGVDGFEVLRTLQNRGSNVPVIVYTGTDNYERCVRAIKLGAFSFIAKDEPLERVAQEVQNALSFGQLQQEVTRLRRQAGDDSPLVGQSRSMLSLQKELERLSGIPSCVLIVGESGSGKELVARQLHRLSDRARAIFWPINCAALPEALVESELFGHERGAFTGADRTRQGAFETAAKGSLFLDEVGELPLAAQAKLLRVLEDGLVTRLGAVRSLQTNCRVITATNRDLDREVRAGRFREDLLFRLNVHTVRVPPLRERLSDMPLLVEHFLALTCERFGLRPKTAAPPTVELLQRHEFSRNNVRELRNVIERLVISCDEAVIGPEHIPADLGGTSAPPRGQAAPAPATPDSALTRSGTLKELKMSAERQIILAALERNAWHISNTAAELGLADHASLLKIMRRHGLKRQ